MPESPKWMLLQSNSAFKGDTINNMHTINKSTNNENSMNSHSSSVNAIYQNEMYSKVAAQLRKLRAPDHDIDGEIAGILSDAKAEAAANGSGEGGEEVTWTEVVAYKQGMIVGIGLMFFQVGGVGDAVVSNIK